MFTHLNEITPDPIAEGRSRYLTHTNDLMMVVVDFNDGPRSEPDAPHWHPHEQVTYVAEGEFLFFLDGKPTHVRPGDLVAVAGDVPHCVQPLTSRGRLVDVFHPIREDFLKK